MRNVKTPRFYTNLLEWLHVSGFKQYDPVYHTMPTRPINYEGGHESEIPINILNEKSFQMILGHNLMTVGSRLTFNHVNDLPFGDYDDFVNSYYDGWDTPEYNGWSLVTCKCGGTTNFKIDLSGDAPTIKSMIIGTYYDMPHSPDLSLTMGVEYGGVKTIETKGGASLSNTFYTKPTFSWELGDNTADTIHGNEVKLTRSGRRVWDLSFSYLQDSDVFPDISSIGSVEAYTDGGAALGKTLLDDDTFYSQVIHRTNGGQLPFVFQPDNTNFNVDNFAIAKFDMNSFSFQQTAPNLYNVKLKIREVW